MMENGHDLKAEANRLYAEKQFRSAIEVYSKAIELSEDCKNPVLFSNRSAVYFECGDYQSSLLDIEKCLSILQESDEALKTKVLARKEQPPTRNDNSVSSFRSMLGFQLPFYAVGNESVISGYDALMIKPDVSMEELMKLSAPKENKYLLHSEVTPSSKPRCLLLAVMGDPRHLLSTCLFSEKNEVLIGNDYNRYLMTRNVLLLDAIYEIKHSSDPADQAYYVLNLWLSPSLPRVYYKRLQATLKKASEMKDFDHLFPCIKETNATFQKQVAETCKEWYQLKETQFDSFEDMAWESFYFVTPPHLPNKTPIPDGFLGFNRTDPEYKVLQFIYDEFVSLAEEELINEQTKTCNYLLTWLPIVSQLGQHRSFGTADRKETEFHFNPTLRSKNVSKNVYSLAEFALIDTIALLFSFLRFGKKFATENSTIFQKGKRNFKPSDILGSKGIVWFFLWASDALNDRVKINLHCVDFFELVHRVKAGSVDRILLSNVNDYTTHLPIFAELTSLLKPNGSFVSQTLAENSLFRNVEHYMMEKNGMNSVTMEKLFGISLATGSLWGELLHIKKFEKDKVGNILSDIPSLNREEFIELLVSLFLFCALPDTGRSRQLLTYLAMVERFTPLNLEAFYRVLFYLRWETSYPAHWLDIVLEKVQKAKSYEYYRSEDMVLQGRWAKYLSLHAVSEERITASKQIEFEIPSKILIQAAKTDNPSLGVVFAEKELLDSWENENTLRKDLAMIKVSTSNVHVFSCLNGKPPSSHVVRVPLEIAEKLDKRELYFGAFSVRTYQVYRVSRILV